ncbi:MAG: response regulator transcription factor [Ignavibacteriales bacterium]|nr:response regulator transcription factor [Ignavibacteriales bacterium]MCF8314485.1 response regulator transcription factor [Ignavibacteriales bacterium]MCF8436478.1 response regulator transcription factor [Ignavibacteriales bacterium]
MKHKILLVDDEKDIVEFLEYNLLKEGFDVLTAFDGNQALKMAEQKPDLIVLDVMMPGADGYEVLTKIRKNKSLENIPVILLTAKSGENFEVHGLNIGADAFIQKPVSPAKIIAHIKANLRKRETGVPGTKEEIIAAGPIVIDREQYKIIVDNETLQFPRKEFEILAYLAAHPGKVFSRDRLLSDIWGTDIFVVERTVDVHIRKIREKLGKHAELIETIKGVGYRFRIPG